MKPVSATKKQVLDHIEKPISHKQSTNFHIADKPKVATTTVKPVSATRKQVLDQVEKSISQHQTKVTTNKPTQNSALHGQAVKPSSDSNSLNLVRLTCCFM